MVHEADEPDLVIDFGNAHMLACKDRTEVDFTPADADTSTARHLEGAVMAGILGRLRLEVPAGRGCIQVAWVEACQALMGALVVVYVQERIKALLLLQEVERGLLLEGQVHAFMAAVLLRASGLDALDADTEAQPPDGEPAESEQGMGAGEGDAVVGADGVGQAEGPEGMLEHLEGTALPGGLEALAGPRGPRRRAGSGFAGRRWSADSSACDCPAGTGP